MSRCASDAAEPLPEHVHPAPDRRRWADVLKHRWPTWLGIAPAAFCLVVIRQWLPPDFWAWLLVPVALVYLVFGAVRKQLRSPGLLALETVGVLVFSALALAALYVDRDLGRYLLAAGWLAMPPGILLTTGPTRSCRGGMPSSVRSLTSLSQPSSS